ncbi:hypothetical protein CRENBAI_017966 [Crenichthys baileyi]|uniref:Uncharacterized protein n=1 Tax=Crenichthys baileyi TaxID=28760 RepID=A0AAV9R030_9TELE
MDMDRKVVISLSMFQHSPVLCRVDDLCLRDTVEWGARSRLAAPSHPNASTELVRASDQDASWMPRLGCLSFQSHWRKTPGETQNHLEALYTYGLGMAISV